MSENKSKRYLIFGGVVVLTIAVLALLVTIIERVHEGRVDYLMITKIEPLEPDPDKWKVNFTKHYDDYMKTYRTADLVDYPKFGKYGGPVQFSKLEEYEHLKRLWAGYPFSLDYNQARGHMNALQDMLDSERLGDDKPGTCMSCKSPEVPLFMEEYGIETFYRTPVRELVDVHGFEHSVSCADCHDAETMDLRISRPAFTEAMERRGVDLSQATRQEMRSYACAQCHVEYYFKGEGNYLTFPWDYGLTIDDIEEYFDERDFADWVHAETKAPMIKIQHPEFELWSTGVHSRANVSCADCHMTYKREGAVKITDHWIRSPLVNISQSCLTCHRQDEEEMRDRVIQIQERTKKLLARTEDALIDAIDAIVEAMEAGASDAALEEARQYHRSSQIRWDFIFSENSTGFHSPQESARILGDAIDYARKAEFAAFRAMVGADPIRVTFQNNQ